MCCRFHIYHEKDGFVSFIPVQDDVRIKSSTSWPDGRIRVCAH